MSNTSQRKPTDPTAAEVVRIVRPLIERHRHLETGTILIVVASGVLALVLSLVFDLGWGGAVFAAVGAVLGVLFLLHQYVVTPVIEAAYRRTMEAMRQRFPSEHPERPEAEKALVALSRDPVADALLRRLGWATSPKTKGRSYAIDRRWQVKSRLPMTVKATWDDRPDLELGSAEDDGVVLEPCDGWAIGVVITEATLNDYQDEIQALPGQAKPLDEPPEHGQAHEPAPALPTPRLEATLLEWQSGERIRKVAQLPGLNMLRVVDSAGVRLADLELLAVSPTIEHLALVGSGQISGEALRRVLDDADLQALELEGFTLSAEDVKKIADAANLQHLELRHCEGIDDAGVRRLAAADALEVLTLSDVPGIDDEGLAALRDLERLTDLRLQSCPNITADALATLRELKHLEVLDLEQSALTDGALAQLTTLPKLNELYLESCRHLTDAAAPSLAAARELQVLHLDETGLGDDALEPISELPDLRALSLTGCPITDEGLQHLQGARRLQEIWLDQTRVTSEGARRLQAALPGCHIHQ